MVPVEVLGLKSYPSSGHEELDLSAGFRVFWENRRGFLGISLIGAILGFLMSFCFPLAFQATVSFLPTDPSHSFKFQALISQLSDSGGIMPSGSLRSSGEQLGILLRSRTLSEKIRKRFPDIDEHLVPGFPFFVTSLGGNERSGLERLLRSIGVVSPSRMKPLEFRVELQNASVAAAVANEYLAVLASHIQESNMTQAAKSRVYIEEQVEKNRRELQTAEETLKEFQVAHHLVSINLQTENAMRLVSDLKGRLLMKEIERDVLLKTTTRATPEVRRLEDEILALRQQVTRLEEGAEEMILDMNREGFSPEARLLKGSLASAPQLILDFYRLKRTVDAFQKVFEFLTQQLLMARIQEQMETPSFTIIDPAEVPEKPIRPRRWLFAVIGGLLGFLGACVWLPRRQGKTVHTET
jgi:uncharacterized protein involved in exopolysaccharide biosynthesis